MTMNQTQIDGITKARLLANIANAGTSAPQFPDNAAYAAHVWPDGDLPEWVADDYARQHAGETIEALETRLAVALAQPEAEQPTPEPEAPADPLDAAKAAALGIVRATVAAKTLLKGPGSVCTTPFGPVNCDESSRVNISGAVTGALAAGGIGQPFAVTWTMADNTRVPLDGMAMIGMGLSVLQFVAAVHGHAQMLKEAINAAPDLDAVAAVDVYAGWP
jgi:hypothetical protein